MKKLDFLILGAQKSGTTALAQFLDQHENISISKPKECHLFDQEDFSPDWTADEISERYLPYFAGCSPDDLWGEATPVYLYYPEIAKDLAKYNPLLKIIVILREPADRAVSHYVMETERGLEQHSLPVALLFELWRLKYATNSRRIGSSYRKHSYRSRGLYHRQLTNLHDSFDRNRVLIISQSDLLNRHAETLCKVFSFLCVANKDNIRAEIVFRSDYNGANHKLLKALLRLSYFQEYRRLNKLIPGLVDSWFASD